MKDDPYSINPYNSETFQVNATQHALWNDFLKAINKIINKDNTPGKKTRKTLLDRNCWELLFYGYREESNQLAINILREGNFSVDEQLFNHNVKTLFTIFDFDLKSFYEVWTYQRNIKRLLHQIVNEKNMIGNRFSKKKGLKKPKYPIICQPSRHDSIPLPKLHRILDGLLFPVIVSKNNRDYKVQRLQTTNFGDGDFITCKGEVIDCIRVNDFWQTRNHLKQRLAFSYLVQSDYDEAPMIVCNNMRDIEHAWKMLDANPSDGVLVRSLGENLYENYWLLLNKNSSFVAMYTKGGFSMHRSGRNKRGFVTLEGRHVGTLGYTYTALKKMNWLDKFDIQRFQKVVFQQDDYDIEEDILRENNRYDMTPDFDFGLFDLDELNKIDDDD